MHAPIDLFAAQWVTWHGGKQPVTDETMVQVRYRHHSLADPRPPLTSTPARAAWFRIGSDWWRHESKNRENDIVAYRVVQ